MKPTGAARTTFGAAFACSPNDTLIAIGSSDETTRLYRLP